MNPYRCHYSSSSRIPHRDSYRNLYTHRGSHRNLYVVFPTEVLIGNHIVVSIGITSGTLNHLSVIFYYSCNKASDSRSTSCGGYKCGAFFCYWFDFHEIQNLSSSDSTLEVRKVSRAHVTVRAHDAPNLKQVARKVFLVI